MSVRLKVTGLTKTYGKQKVLNDISLEVKEKEIVGFIGPNGAGKSTTMKCISNLIFPDCGEIEICGYNLKTQTSKALSSHASLIEEPGLYKDLTGMDHIRLIGDLRGVSKERMGEIAEFTELKAGLNKKVRGYSVGMKQRLGLGLALLGKPKFLVLDEPMSGLDPTGVIQLRRNLRNLREENVSILLSSHQLGEVAKLADRLVFIDQGNVFEPEHEVLDMSRYTVSLEDPKVACHIVNQNFSDVMVQKKGAGQVSIVLPNEVPIFELLLTLGNNDCLVHDVIKETVDIESIYRKHYGDANA